MNMSYFVLHMKRETLTISLPSGMAEQVRRASRAEFRTNSELVREALRHYLKDRFPLAETTAPEKRAIARGKADFKTGDFTPLSRLRNDLISGRGKVSRKKTS
jgi:Arc/MetJ-type ribon-helix-helix transcriptional regulator